MSRRIVHFLRRVQLEEGGVVRAALDLCEGAAGAGADVSLLTWSDQDAPEAWRAEGASPRVTPIDPPARPGGLFSRAQIRDLAPLIREADVLHLHATWTPANMQLGRLARRLGTPYIASVHGMLDDWSMAQRTLKKRAYLALGGRRYFERAARTHFTATGEREQSMKHIPRATPVVIPLMMDLADFRDLPGPDPARNTYPQASAAEPVVLFLSRLHYKKGVDLLIDAAETLRDRSVPCRTLIAGAGDKTYTDALRRRVAERGLEDRVFFLGMVLGREKVSLYQLADVFVLPTSQENFGFVLPEALAAETPVVTTRGVDTWPELEASGGAVIADRSAPAIADAVAELLADPERRRIMGERGRAWVFENLDADRVARAYIDLYEQAVSESG